MIAESTLTNFFKNLGSFAKTPGGVSKLRELICTLAVKGKLVEQDARDESARVLLDRVRDRRAELVDEGVIRNNLPMRDKDLPGQPLPAGWVWAKFGEVTYNRDGDRVPVRKSDRECQAKVYDYYGASGVIDKVAGFLFDTPLLLIGEDGANLVNRTTPIAFIAEGKYWVNNHAHVVDALSRVLLEYLRVYINSISLEPYITGMAQPKMNQARMNSIPIALPPLAEQRRIVTKVDSLMSKCDELETEQQREADLRQRASRASLHALTAATDRSELQSAWRRLNDHFETLYDTPETLEDLRQTILQLAVQGKLVEQDPEDEPSDKLLSKINERRNELIAAGTRRKTRTAPIESSENTASHWKWARLADIIHIMDSGWSPSCENAPTRNAKEWGVLKTTAVQPMEFWEQAHKRLPEALEPRPEAEAQSGDLLITRAGPKNRVGVACLIREVRPRLMISDKIIRFHLIEPLMCAEFVVLSLNAGISRDYIDASKSGMAESQMNISQTKLKATPIPIPPFAEQLRIVDKVNQLLRHCDELAAHLEQRRDTTEQLLTAMVHRLLEDQR